jgi:uncharacterized protein YdhG (YjbR/CyaY superfamily)
VRLDGAARDAEPPGQVFVAVPFRDELQDFDVSGRTIRFSATRPLPATLVKRIVKARVQEDEARAKA